MAGSKVLSLSQVRVDREGRTILGPLDFAINAGERWVILGPNGAGKSTLLNLLATRIHPTSGTISLLDKKVGEVDIFELRNSIGLVGSALDIPGDEKVKDVVLTAAYSIIGRWNEVYDLWDESRAIALLTTFGVRELGDRRFATLSEGERKRALIARALMVDPELLLLDEPTAGLDLGGREDVLRRFSLFAADPSSPASVIVTHHIEEIPEGTTHALLIKEGQIWVSGPVEGVITSEHISALFDLPIHVSRLGERFIAQRA